MMFDGLDTLLTYVRLSSPLSLSPPLTHLPRLPTIYYLYHTTPQPLVAETLSDTLKKEAQLAFLKQV